MRKLYLPRPRRRVAGGFVCSALSRHSNSAPARGCPPSAKSVMMRGGGVRRLVDLHLE